MNFDLCGFLLRISLLFFLFSFALFLSDLGFLLGLFDLLAFLSGLIGKGFLVLCGLCCSICLCLLCNLLSLGDLVRCSLLVSSSLLGHSHSVLKLLLFGGKSSVELGACILLAIDGSNRLSSVFKSSIIGTSLSNIGIKLLDCFLRFLDTLCFLVSLILFYLFDFFLSVLLSLLEFLFGLLLFLDIILGILFSLLLLHLDLFSLLCVGSSASLSFHSLLFSLLSLSL